MTRSENPSNSARNVPSPTKSRWLGWSLFWVYNFFLYQSAILPSDRIPIILVEIDDKLFHSILYVLLFLFSMHAFLGAKRDRLRLQPIRFAFLWCLLMGILTEVSQAFVPSRSASFLDFVADLMGAGIGFLFYVLFKRVLRKAGPR